jgi:hypothetical protein
MLKEFDSVVLKHNSAKGGYYILIPFNVFEAFGSRMQVKVHVYFETGELYTYLQPMGDGTHYMSLPNTIIEQNAYPEGKTIRLKVEAVVEDRNVPLPQCLTDVIDAEDPKLRKVFEGLAYTRRKDYVQMIESAKKEETRQKRIEKIMADLRLKLEKML